MVLVWAIIDDFLNLPNFLTIWYIVIGHCAPSFTVVHNEVYSKTKCTSFTKYNRYTGMNLSFLYFQL